jgi:chromosome segregation ATPase
MSDAIDQAAFRVAEAESKLEAAKDTLAAAQNAADQTTARVAALHAERSEIVRGARAGSTDHNAALRIAVIDADIADLAPLVADAQAGIAAAQAEVNRASQQVAVAEQALAAAKDEEAERLLVAHVDQLAQLLGSGIAELRAIWHRKHARPVWAPSTELVRELERLRFVADGRQSPGHYHSTRRSAA